MQLDVVKNGKTVTALRLEISSREDAKPTFAIQDPFTFDWEKVQIPATPKAYARTIQWAAKHAYRLEVSAAVEAWYRDEAMHRSAFSPAPDFVSFPAVDGSEMYPFQHQAVRWLLANYDYNDGQMRALIADDPRLGKSITALTALDTIGAKGPLLILCLKSLITQWKQYVNNWYSFNEDVLVLFGSAHRRMDTLKYVRELTHPVIITNWETLRMGVFDYGPKKWWAILGDEAHVVKNRQSDVFDEFKRLRSTHMLLLSATFTEKTAADWWTPLHLIKRKRFSSYWRFAGAYSKLEDNGYGYNVHGARNQVFMEDETWPYIIRRRAEEVADLPEIVEEVVVAGLDAKHRRFYKEVEKETVLALSEGDLDIPNTAARIVRLRQVSLHPGLLDAEAWDKLEIGKFAVLKELVEDVIPSHEQVIVYCTFRMGAEMASWILGDSVLLEGKDFDEAIERFADGSARVLCATPWKGGVGLNLDMANYIVYLDRPWSSIAWRQSRDRATKIGKSGHIGVYTIAAKGTVDEYVSKVLHRKLETIAEADVVKDVLDNYFKIRYN